MLPKSQLKQIAQLGQKKFRDQTGLFVVEGIKSVQDFLDQGWGHEGLFATTAYERHPATIVSPDDMRRMTQFKTASPILGVFKKPKASAPPLDRTVLVLDGIRDPGNLGTIIRQASWFGIAHVVCSPDSTDCYNPKVIQASMGAMARVQLHYAPIDSFLKQFSYPVIGLDLEGASIYDTLIQEPLAIVFGSESHGISDSVVTMLDQKITIPPKHPNTVESLNVASAAAITLALLLR